MRPLSCSAGNPPYPPWHIRSLDCGNDVRSNQVIGRTRIRSQVQELSAAIVKADRMLAESAMETERLATDIVESERRYETELARLRDDVHRLQVHTRTLCALVFLLSVQ